MLQSNLFHASEMLAFFFGSRLISA